MTIVSWYATFIHIWSPQSMVAPCLMAFICMGIACLQQFFNFDHLSLPYVSFIQLILCTNFPPEYNFKCVHPVMWLLFLSLIKREREIKDSESPDLHQLPSMADTSQDGIPQAVIHRAWGRIYMWQEHKHVTDKWEKQTDKPGQNVSGRRKPKKCGVYPSHRTDNRLSCTNMFKPWLCRLLILQIWVNHFISLYLSFLF